MRYQLSLEAEGLKKSGRLRTGCPYAVVTVCGGPGEGTEIGRTETINDNLNPNWTRILYVETDATIFMPIRVTIFDKDEKRGDKLMAEAHFEVTELYESPGNTQFQTVAKHGIIRVHVQRSQIGGITGTATVQLRGLDIKNIERGMLGLGVADPFYEIAKKKSDLIHGISGWSPVFRSETIFDNLNPFWDEHEISLEALCHGDLDWPLKITVMDWQKNGKHREIGYIETSIQHLRERVAIKGNADRSRALEIVQEDKERGRGLLVVIKFDMVLNQHGI